MDLFFDQEFRTLIPPLAPEERQGLIESLKREGNRDAIVIWKETKLLLDGHNRYDICHENGIDLKPPLPLSFPDRDAAKEWVIRNQFGRRNLVPYQRSVLVIKLEDIIAARAKAKQVASGGAVVQKSGEPPVKTENELAKLAHVSHDTIWKVKQIEAKATPEQKKKLVEGTSTIHKVYTKIKQEEQHRERDRRRQEALTNPVNQNGHDVITGDLELLYDKLTDNSVDLFFTDPPYDRSSLECFTNLAKLAQQKLKPGGLCLAYTGQSHMDKALEGMAQYLEYWWTFAIFLSGAEQRIWSKNLWVRWKPILVFGKKPIAARLTDTWCCDYVRGAGEDKRFHEWGQDIQEAIYWIEALTTPGALVVDPFCGGGTIPLACKLSQRHWVATEIDDATAAIARKRLGNDKSPA